MVSKSQSLSSRQAWLAAGTVTIGAFLLYLYTLAPGLTWSHFGADGGELIAAAVTNGVPHPPGYPLYMLLLRGWLSLGRLLLPTVELAWLGNLFSALCAALSGGVTVLVVEQLLRRASSYLSASQAQKGDLRWLWAMLIGLAWSSAPLLWEQAVITEVYALHALLISLLGWALLVKEREPIWLVLPIGLGVAHHLTYVLLLPGVIYWLWSAYRNEKNTQAWWIDLIRAGIWVALGVVVGLLFYLRIPLAAQSGAPINWGYPDNWEGFWWLTSASAYRSYLFGVPSTSVFDRIASWAYQLTSQFTAVGLGLSLLGLSFWDREEPRMRNWGLLWLLPISIYAISYYTRDSTIYLLPCIWLAATWSGVGLWWGEQWLRTEMGAMKKGAVLAMLPSWFMPTVVGLALLLLLGFRLPEISLRQDQEAISYLEQVADLIPERVILISTQDAETFALWYGVWASGELLPPQADGESSLPDGTDQTQLEPVLINPALMQFGWYRRLIQERYHFLPGIEGTLVELLRANLPTHTIFLTEETPIDPRATLTATGPLWIYTVE